MTSTARQESLEPTPGQQVAAARRTRGQNQEDLARALSAYMGIPWSRPGVSALENGEKTFTVAILKAVAAVQRFPYSWYLDGPYNGPTAPPSTGAIPR